MNIQQLKDLNKPKKFTHEFLEPIEINRVNIDGKRHYRTKHGDFISVTTFLDLTSDKTSLKEWEERVGKEKAEQIKKDAADRGTLFHEAVEDYLKNEPIKKTSKLFSKVKYVLDRLDRIKLLEGALYSVRLKLSGTVDLVAYYDGKLCVIDFKTSIKPKKEEWLENYWLQLSLYSIFIKERYNLTIPNLLIIMINETTNKPQIFKSNIREHIPALKKRLEIYRNLK